MGRRVRRGQGCALRETPFFEAFQDCAGQRAGGQSGVRLSRLNRFSLDFPLVFFLLGSSGDLTLPDGWLVGGGVEAVP